MKKACYVGGAFLTLLLLYTFSYMIWLYTPIEYTGPEIQTIQDLYITGDKTFDRKQDLCGYGREWGDEGFSDVYYYINCANQHAFRKARGIAASANRTLPEPYQVNVNLVKYSQQNLEDMRRELRVNFDRSFQPALRDVRIDEFHCKLLAYADRITPEFEREVEKIISKDIVQYEQYYPPQIAVPIN